MRANHLLFEGRQIQLDKDGYLKNLGDWNSAVAQQLAAVEEVRLSPAHWEVIYLLRKFYEYHQVAPATRALVNLVKRDLGRDKGRSIYLMRLFKSSPAKLANKIAGLPKPVNCI
ncbi:MAG: TusE/DsrC/DsvC family sulfur relay protein [Gammaproteobacteria bacterium]|jgi:tRNA 2-thiouridine synthesizing protein E|nr:TusE/DsrC/DsvC family sulfur relay protein [Gammaproteobacteria bacterium]|tara:strand:- start:120 stop:461 length:342 start_codon:yes stop_codon:yes gene_type:complete